MIGMDAGSRRPWFWTASTALALIPGAALVADTARVSSAAYDEVAYLQIGSEWWRFGKQDRIARMGSPLTFWKIQQAPVLWGVDRSGDGRLIDDPIEHQAELLPRIRLGSLWIWASGLVLTAAWARREHGPMAMACGAWLYALSPNLIAHGALATMELPLVASAAAASFAFCEFLRSGSRGAFWGSAGLCGLAFSCKFTAVLLPPLFGLAWLLELRRRSPRHPIRLLTYVGGRMIGFVAIMAIANIAVTAGATLPLSEQRGDHPRISEQFGSGFGELLGSVVEVPIPQDWAAFARQWHHQKTGGPGYLLGETSPTGWRHYYLVALAVKVPLGIWLLLLCRGLMWRSRTGTVGDRLAMTLFVGAMTIIAIGSSRNYGYRYLLFLAPVAIVWVSALVNRGPRGKCVALLGIALQAAAVGSIHPHELSYFNILVGGPEGGKHVLADSNLDWGQGALSFARLQQRRPEFRDVALFSFGDTDPGYYGVCGDRFLIDAHGPRRPLPPGLLAAQAPYIAVSRSLQYGPWGPAGYFAPLNGLAPVAVTDDHTIAVYRRADLRRRGGGGAEPGPSR